MKKQPAHEERLRRMATAASARRFRNESTGEPRKKLLVQTVIKNPDGVDIGISFKKDTILASMMKKKTLDIRLHRRLNKVLHGFPVAMLASFLKIEKPLLKWITSKKVNAETFFLDPASAIERSRVTKDPGLLRMIRSISKKMALSTVRVGTLPIHSINIEGFEKKATARTPGKSNSSSIKGVRTTKDGNKR